MESPLDLELSEAARGRTERWALVAGVTGCTANALLVALYAVALPGNDAYDWTGPANDVVGAVSTLSAIPMALGVRDLLGRPGRLPGTTTALIVSSGAMAAASGLLVTHVIDLRVQVAVAVPFLMTTAAWMRSAGRWGRVTGRLPRRLSRAAEVLGVGALSGMAVTAAAALLPWGSPAQLAVGGTGMALAAGAYLGLPVWQIELSRQLARRPDARTTHGVVGRATVQAG